MKRVGCEQTATYQWHIAARYQSKSQCERAKAARMTTEEAQMKTWAAAQCIASDDPRLKEPSK
jgi:hypothetical protein